MKRLIPIAVFISLVFLSCEKEGPAGPAGPAGPNGPAGPSGPAGPAGTANVIYSEWLDLTFSPVKNDAGDTLAFVDTIATDKLNNEILTSGSVKVYFNWGTAEEPSIETLPLTDLIILQGLNIYPIFEPGQIILFSNLNVSSANTDNGKVFQIRYILIPGGVPAVRAPDWSNYSAVKSYLKLEN